MKSNGKKGMLLAAVLLAAFVLFTLCVRVIDVKPIGPQGSRVGFAALNQWVHSTLGVHELLYTITDWASILAILFALGFAVLGLCQLIQRRSLWKVDISILTLGGFYLLVFGAYLFFECFAVNFRPVLIDGYLEASYPSSTTMLVMCIMPTAMMQFDRLLQHKKVKCFLNVFCAVFTVLMVVGRLLSGVHWFTDIFAGALLSTALVVFYAAATRLLEQAALRREPPKANKP